MLYTKSIKYPNPFSLQSGKTDVSDGVKSINECIGLILTTAKGELLGDPDFGCTLYEILFEQYSLNTEALIKKEIAESINTYEHRVTVSEQDVNIEESMDDIGHKNRYKITISYMINNTSKINTTSVIVEGRDFYG